MEIYVDNDAKLTLHGLRQYYIKLAPAEKNRKLNDLLDALEFNQVVIFVSKIVRASELNRLLQECNFPSVVVHGRIPQAERCVLRGVCLFLSRCVFLLRTASPHSLSKSSSHTGFAAVYQHQALQGLQGVPQPYLGDHRCVRSWY